jgi:hypothetical protein
MLLFMSQHADAAYSEMVKINISHMISQRTYDIEYQAGDNL